MHRKNRDLARSALIAALYVVLTHGQNLILPNSTSMAIQFRASEALCVLALFTPAAIPGLTIGCVLFNVTNAAALPLDAIVGGLATLIAAWTMWLSRRITVKGYPLPGLLLPVISNAVLVGWELAVYIGGGFWINAVYVAIGEAADFRQRTVLCSEGAQSGPQIIRMTNNTKLCPLHYALLTFLYPCAAIPVVIVKTSPVMGWVNVTLLAHSR